MWWPSAEFLQGLVVSGVPCAAWLMRLRLSREGRAQALYDRLMDQFRAEIHDLKEEVNDCRKRDARVLIVETCFRLALPEVLRLDPASGVLGHVKALLEGLPILPNGGEWQDLLDKISDADNRFKEGEHAEQI